MKASFFAVVFFACSISAFGNDIGWKLSCLSNYGKKDSSCAEFLRKQDSIQVIRDSLFQYLSNRITISVEKKKKNLKFKDVNVQEFSRKNEQHGIALFSLVAKSFFDSTSTLIPKKRIEKTSYWIVPCHVSWYEDGIYDGETAVCLSKNSIWPCFTEWQNEKKENDLH